MRCKRLFATEKVVTLRVLIHKINLSLYYEVNLYQISVCCAVDVLRGGKRNGSGHC